MSTPIISVENLSKAFRIGAKEEVPDTITQGALGLLKSPLKNLRNLRNLDTSSIQDSTNQNDLESESDVLWALRDVSFEVNQGDVVGVIGRNGAGKSTLLKVLSRITEPTSGRAIIRGRVSSLLEVGTGFHPELTGRENVYMNGTILGMTKREIDSKFDEIVDFSGVERFLDTPTKRYSSGMQVRLAFAVAAHLEPEVLVVDEVLAVGDADFQQKCLAKMQSVSQQGRTVLFVSHNVPAVERLCSRAILIKNGKLSIDSSVNAALEGYLTSTRKPSLQKGFFQLNVDSTESNLRYLHVLDQHDVGCSEISSGSRMKIRIGYQTTRPIIDPRFAIVIRDSSHSNVFMLNSRFHHGRLPDLSSSGELSVEIDNVPLIPGRYFLETWLRGTIDGQLHSIDHHLSAGEFIVQDADIFGTGEIYSSRHGSALVPSTWVL